VLSLWFPAAISALTILISPNSSLSRENDIQVADDTAAAGANVDSSTDRLADREMVIGRYYVAKHDYTAAINRFKTVATQYQATRYVEETLEQLTVAYLAIGIVKEAQTAAAVLGRKFPDGSWYGNALDLLKQAGLEPHEDENSWISRTFR
jgi:outer membrane protein assembly factor BamD